MQYFIVSCVLWSFLISSQIHFSFLLFFISCVEGVLAYTLNLIKSCATVALSLT